MLSSDLAAKMSDKLRAMQQLFVDTSEAKSLPHPASSKAMCGIGLIAGLPMPMVLAVAMVSKLIRTSHERTPLTHTLKRAHRQSGDAKHWSGRALHGDELLDAGTFGRGNVQRIHSR